MSSHDEILTIPELAELLKIARKTVYVLVQRGEIPAFKVGGQWRFSRGAINTWIDARSAGMDRFSVSEPAPPRRRGKHE
jgi:excisionase family DNA binding protein